MVDYPPDRIAGPRLVLRPPMPDDAGAIFQRVDQPMRNIMRMHVDRHTASS